MDRRGGEPWTRVLIFFWSPAAEDDEMSTASQQTPAPLSLSPLQEQIKICLLLPPLHRLHLVEETK